eukprot:4121483-Amphidinium_carterae.1
MVRLVREHLLPAQTREEASRPEKPIQPAVSLRGRRPRPRQGAMETGALQKIDGKFLGLKVPVSAHQHMGPQQLRCSLSDFKKNLSGGGVV